MVFPLCWYNMLATNCIKKPWSDFIFFIFIFLQHKSGEARVSCYCRVNCYCVHVYKLWHPRLFTPLFSRIKINAQTGYIVLVVRQLSTPIRSRFALVFLLLFAVLQVLDCSVGCATDETKPASEWTVFTSSVACGAGGIVISVVLFSRFHHHQKT